MTKISQFGRPVIYACPADDGRQTVHGYDFVATKIWSFEEKRHVSGQEVKGLAKMWVLSAGVIRLPRYLRSVG